MQLDNQNMDKLDDFSRAVSEKVKDYRMPVDASLWDGINRRLTPARKPVIGRWGWAVAVAAVFAGLLLLLNPFSTEHTPEQTVQEILPKKEISPLPEAPVLAEKKQKTESISGITKEKIFAQNHSKTVPIKTLPMEGQATEALSADTKENHEAEENRPLPPDDKQLPPVSAENIAEIPDSEKNIAEVRTENGQSVSAEKQQSVIAGEKRDESVDLLASLTRSVTPVEPFANMRDSAPVMDNFPGDGYTTDGSSENSYNMLTPKDYTDIKHDPPVSFSLMAGFPLAKNLNVETGLTYTYLLSHFKRNDDVVYRAKLHQHYVGIPVNLRYTIWQNDAWGMYVLAGGSIEKGLRSIYKQEIERNGGVVFHTNARSRIDGFQFSAQGGAGFHYRLNNQFYLFAEPRLVYYFQNKQPMSSRTENPLTFGLNMGVRVQFK